MTIIREIFPQCDFCGETNCDIRAPIVALVRRSMKANGWHVVDGKDMCESCWEARKAEAKS